jgi:uroporphyrin-III C-methyltransferase
VVKIDAIDRRAVSASHNKTADRGNRQLEAGEVAIVGAGPGDPELLTVRAWKLIRDADVLVYDRLVSEAIIDLAPVRCEKVYVGKQCGRHAMTQTQINMELARRAKEGKKVVRLKGGDPYIFGRGAEEVLYLAERNIRSQVVPGITSASGCTTYANIPLTHRDCAQICTFVTGHLKEGRLRLPWQNLAAPNQTVVFYMGISNAEIISWNMQEHGRDPATPVALIEKGTTPEQRVVLSTLSGLVEDIKRQDVKSPALIVVGEVVDYHALIAAASVEMEKVAHP